MHENIVDADRWSGFEMKSAKPSRLAPKNHGKPINNAHFVQTRARKQQWLRRIWKDRYIGRGYGYIWHHKGGVKCYEDEKAATNESTPQAKGTALPDNLKETKRGVIDGTQNY